MDQSSSKEVQSDSSHFTTYSQYGPGAITQSDLGDPVCTQRSLYDSLTDAARSGGPVSKLQLYIKLWAEHKPSRNNYYLPFYDVLTYNNPLMTISPIDNGAANLVSNFSSLLCNSIRREMADMWVYILPGLHERCRDLVCQEDCDDLRCWWSGFLSYNFSVSTGFERILKLLFKEYEKVASKGSQDHQHEITKQYHLNVNTIIVGFEAPLRRMDDKMKELSDFKTEKHLQDMEEFWRRLCNFILQSFDNVYNFAKVIECQYSVSVSNKDIQKVVQDMLKAPKYAKHTSTTRYRANIVTSMIRWLPSEDDILKWTTEYGMKELDLEKAVMLYAWGRRICKFQVDRKPTRPPTRIRMSS